MKVIVIGRAFPEKKTGMHGIFEFEQAEEIQKLGHEVTYLYCDIRSIKYQKEVKFNKKIVNGVKVQGYNLPLGGFPESIKRSAKSWLMSRLIRDTVCNQKPDIIHIHFPLLTLDSKIVDILKNSNAKIVLTEHWTYVANKRLSVDQIELLNRVADLSAKIICVSEQLKDGFQEYICNMKNADKLCVLPNIVKNNYRRVQSQNTKYSFLFAGRLEPVKRCDMLIDSFEKAFPMSQYQNMKLVIAGNGSQLKNLKEQVRAYDDPRIEFTGFIDRDQMDYMYNNCNVYVSASELETFGVPFAEAWCCGKPIICADNSPIIPYLLEGENGFSFITNSMEDLAKKMTRIFEDDVNMTSLQIEEYGRKHFSAEIVIKELEKIYIGA